MTVLVLPEVEDAEVNIEPDDYRVDVFLPEEHIAEHLVRIEGAVRVTHYETGMVVSMQNEKSQIKNLAKAMRILKSRLYDHRRNEAAHWLAAGRLAGSGDRSKRIRTYNFPENRVTDHRIDFALDKLDQVINGQLQPVLDALIDYERNEIRLEMDGPNERR